MDFKTRTILRALKKLGFEGDDLDYEYIYFCSLPYYVANYYLVNMVQQSGNRRPKS